MRASLHSVKAFILASISGQIWTKNVRASASLRSAKASVLPSISVQIWSKNVRALIGQGFCFAFNLRSNLEQKYESFGFLPAKSFVLPSTSVQIWSKNTRASASLRSAKAFVVASISVKI